MRPPSSSNLVNRIVALTLCFLVFSGTLGLAAVWVRQEIFSTANRTHTFERQIADVERRLTEVEAGVAVALSPRALLARNDTMRLGLELPREVQVVWLTGSPELRLATKRNREIFTVTTASFNRAPRGSAPVFTLAAHP